MNQKNIAPLSWIHLAESLRPSFEQIRIVLDAFPANDAKCFAQLFYRNSSVAIADPYRFLNDNLSLSIRQKACIHVLAYADISSVKRDHFLLNSSQLATLLHFASDVTIEIKNIGAIVPSPKPAQIQAQFSKQDKQKTAISFVAVHSGKHIIENPTILGEKDTYLLDNHLCLYHLDPPLLPSETVALLNSPALPIEGLNTEAAQLTFSTIAEMGVDLSCTKILGQKSEETPITLRTILNSDKNSGNVELRLHLVTAFEFEGTSDEVEIPAQGFLPPLFPLCAKPSNAITQDNGQTYLMLRPTEKEEKARLALFSLGAVASSSHRGFTAKGQRALEVLSAINKNKGMPSWLLIDQDTLPKIINLPKKPLLTLTNNKLSQHEVMAQIRLKDFDFEFPIKDIVKIANNDGTALLIDDDTIVTFDKETAHSLSVISETLDIQKFNKDKNLSFFEAALLSKSLQNFIDIECSDEIRARLTNFIPEILPQDRLLPQALKTVLRPYQHDAVTWMSQLHRAGLGRLLADDMGLGKTIMVLTLLTKVKEEYGSMPSLVVAPTSVIDVWELEAARHFSGLKVVKWHGPNRNELLDTLSDADIIVTSYALLRKDVDSYLSKINFRYFILDEAQNIKNSRTESWKAARTINAEQKLALTGTPIENRVLDLYNIVDLVAPSILGSESQFINRYANPIAAGNQQRMEELKCRLNPLILRRKKNDVETDLPPKIESVLRCEMAADQQFLYREILKRAQTELKDFLYDGNSKQRAQMPLLAALTRLRQICCDPKLLPMNTEQHISSAKTELFAEVLKECVSTGRRIIVYSQFIKMQRIIHDLIKAEGIHDALWLHGGTKDRAEVVRKFQDPNGPQVIVVSLKAGGTGITLTAADTVIYYDPWWNPAVLDQAADRAHRIGQTKAVHLIKLICENSIEEQILALSEKKRLIAEGILTAQKSGSHSLTMDDIKLLLTNEFDRMDHPEA